MVAKSQISMFFLFGIVIVIAAALIIYISGYRILPLSEVPDSEIGPARAAIGSCFREVAIDAVSFVSLHGGYYEMPEPKAYYFSDYVPYYIHDGAMKVPSIGEIQTQISDYVNGNINDCATGIGNLNGVQVRGSAGPAIAIVENDAITVKAASSIEIYDNKSVAKLQELKTVLKSPMRRVHGVAQKITDEKFAGGDLCADCLMRLANEYDVSIDVDLQGNNTQVYTIFDDKINPDEDYFVFSFATMGG